MGVTEAGRYYVGYVYMVEFQPSSYQADVGLSIFVVHAIVKIFYDLYFALISKEWFFFCIMSIVGSLTCFIIVLKWLPESPRFLVAKHKVEPAKDTFNYMRRVNKPHGD